MNSKQLFKSVLVLTMLLSTVSVMAQSNGHKGLDFSADLGYNIHTKGGGGAISAELELGKRFSDRFYWGLGAGAFILTGDGDPLIPITTDFKVFFTMSSTKLTPFAGLKAGYVINTAEDIKVGTGRNRETISMPNYIMVQIMPGIQFPLSGSVDFNLGAGYTHFIPASSGEGFGAVAIRAGFGFHFSPKHVRRTIGPSKEHAFQLTLEGGAKLANSSGYPEIAIIPSYKLTRTLMVGAGYEFSNLRSSSDEVDGVQHRIFGKVQYRFNDNRIAPFVAARGGFKIHSITADYVKDLDRSVEDPTKTGFFVTPVIGLSWRSTTNSYIDLSLGYEFESGLSERKGEREHKAISLSGPSIKIGYTHTF